MIDDWGISCEITLTWKPHDLTDDKSTLVQVMAWCCQVTSHYLSQCWPRWEFLMQSKYHYFISLLIHSSGKGHHFQTSYFCLLCTESILFYLAVMKLNGSVPVKYGIRLNMDEKYKDLKKHLGDLSSIPPAQLLLTEIGGAVVKVGVSSYFEIIDWRLFWTKICMIFKHTVVFLLGAPGSKPLVVNCLYCNFVW